MLTTLLAILLNCVSVGLNASLAIESYEARRYGWLTLNITFILLGVAVIALLISVV